MTDYDPVAMLRILSAHGVEFVVIGGVAARLRGAPLLTEDLDITPKKSAANWARLAAALSEMNARLRTATEPDGVAFPFEPALLQTASVWTLVTDRGDLDLVIEPAGTRGYEDLMEEAERLVVASDPPLTVTVAALADIIRTKQASTRAKDLAALPLLRQTLDEIDRAGQG